MGNTVDINDSLKTLLDIFIENLTFEQKVNTSWRTVT